MTILVTGGTGKVGSEVVRQLVERRANLRVMVRDPARAALPGGVATVPGDLNDVAATRAALSDVDTLFLLNAVAPDELMQASIAMNLAREAGVERIVYLSILNADRMVDVPHAACKIPIERMIFDQGLPATVLRASMFMQNDHAIQPALLGGVYPWPIGGKGLAHVDVRDVGEVAAIELLRRETAPGPLPPNAITVCGPDELTGDAVAAIWTEVLGRDVAYAGDDLDALERGMLAQGMPAWLAYDFRMMFRAMQVHGQAEPGAAGRVGEILGRPPRTYRAFAEEAASRW